MSDQQTMFETAKAKPRYKSGMTITRALRIETTLQGVIESIFGNATHFYSTHAQINESMKERVWESPSLAKAPAHVRSYLSGYVKARYDEIYRHHLGWMMMVDGKLMSRIEMDELARTEKQAIATSGFITCSSAMS